MNIDVLIPTCNRLPSLVMTLAGVASQTDASLHVVVADQGAVPAGEERAVAALFRIIEARGGAVEYHFRPQVHGIAEQRHFLLGRCRTDAALYLDDDVWMEPWVAERLAATLSEQGCGFAGAFPAGLSFADDHRPEQEAIEYWEGPVRPEVVEPDTARWERWQLHRAANLHHVASRRGDGEIRLYKVAWVASCVAYSRRKLEEVGGFSFWHRLPRFHSGEEVLVQNLLMRRWGGCGIVPSGTYYAELPSTVLNDQGRVDGHAVDLLPELARQRG
ncbi:MAG TPA: glycosyltransferase family A protein [Vicinamibacterales bacterium]|nr:glycosyltransferase family A protein [Vicinamibacterales bacterium]